MTDHEMESWIIFDGSIPLGDFLEKNRPSSMKFVNMAVFTGDPQRRPTVFEFPLSIPEPQKQMLLEKWEKLKTKKRGKITSDDVKHLAKKHSYKSGKWLFNCPSTKIDEIWTSVAKAVVSGTLGSAANLFLSDNQLMEYTVLVYNEDFTKKEQVWAVEKSLRTLGVTFTLRYKPNIYTTLGIYAADLWGKVSSRDRDASKQRARNVPLSSADVHGGGGLHDEPKECLCRGLWWEVPLLETFCELGELHEVVNGTYPVKGIHQKHGFKYIVITSVTRSDSEQ